MTRRHRSALSIWLGLFAMLMIHAGPLISAFQFPSARPSSVTGEHHHHPIATGERASVSIAHHPASASVGGQPAWLEALALCGYCELLTHNPPLSLSLDLTVPHYRPAFAHWLPVEPLPRLRLYIVRQPRAPPAFHG
ncbi:DUF2946 domain-containing protein [Pseudomonas urumqiensis]|uniref:DUF2946 domain-containing protein n=1 Tax=Stutzerimonas urumqiensis TaxID=638269 RepID=UPI0013CE79D9